MHLLGSIQCLHPVREPLERLGDSHLNFDIWEIILYVMGLSFVIEGKLLNFYITFNLKFFHYSRLAQSNFDYHGSPLLQLTFPF